MDVKTTFDEQDIAAFAPAEKIGLVASLNPQGQPHITLITSMCAASPTRLTLGEFCQGQSKANIRRSPHIGFLVMTRDRRIWRGQARWTHSRTEGPEYERYNNMPMFRYNTYFGINTVHYLDLISTTAGARLPMGRIVFSALVTRLAAKNLARTAGPVLTPFAEQLFNRMDAMKFIAYVGPQGQPEIIPIIQGAAAGSTRLVFYPGVYAEELEKIPEGDHVAVFGLTMAMEDVLVRGRFRRIRRFRSIRLGAVEIDWVYNSMPPCHGQIYPAVDLQPVEHFE